MVKFSIEHSGSIGRLGRITQWGSSPIEHNTPSSMTYLRAGHIPHLTWDVVNKQLPLSQQPIYQLTMPSLGDSVKIIEKYGKGAVAFCGMDKESVVHLSPFDPLDQLKSGYNDSKSVAIWTKAGKKTVDVKCLREIVNTFRVDTFDTLVDYDVPRSASNKRLTKAVERTRDFNEQTFKNPETFKATALLSLGGGFSEYHRRKCAVDCGMNTGNEDTPVGGYSVDLHDFWHGNEWNTGELEKLLTETFDPLPKEKLRFVCGPFDPTQVWHLVRFGIDLFDSSFAVKMAEQAKAIRLSDDFFHSGDYDVMDFNMDRYKEDFTSPFDDCKCYCCTNYTKGYLHHLNNTKELLSSILLVIHNMHEYDRMFGLLRMGLSASTV